MKRLITILFLCITMCCTGCTKEKKEAFVFEYWNEDSIAIQELKDYVLSVTDEKSSEYIPVVDRIAVFDLDGTLYCETYPIYGEWVLFADYVLNTPNYEAPQDTP